MKVECHLRVFRGDRKLREIAASADVPMSALSQLERGQLLPRDEWIEKLAAAYGKPITDWYPPTVLLALSGDEA